MFALIFIFLFFYIIQVILVLSALADDIDNERHKYIGTPAELLVFLIPLSVYVLLIIACFVIVKDHFKENKENGN
jgi:hypothetical protein